MTSDEIEHFSYATPEDPRLKRLVIRLIETMTGQPYLKSLYDAHRLNPVPGESFWAAALRSLELKIVANTEALERWPKTGPLVVVANHPFGVLDGLIISHITSQVRDDFLVLTNSVLYRAEEIRPHLLPIDFAETKEALGTNLKSRAAAKAHLLRGGVLVIFPAGGASTAPKPWSRRAVDPEWKNFTARLITGAKAPVVPVYFAGQNAARRPLADTSARTFLARLAASEAGPVRKAAHALEDTLVATVQDDEALVPQGQLPPVESISEETFRKFATALAGPRDRRHGHEIFLQACAPCHRIGNEGSEVGPDLIGQLGVAEESLLKDILMPNERIRPGFETTLVQTREGGALTGLLKSDDATSVTLIQAGAVEQTLLRQDLLGVRRLASSLMPSFAEGLKPADVADLLAWLRSNLDRSATNAGPRPPRDVSQPIQRGEGFLTNLFDRRIDLLPEYQGSRTYWLFHDNYLAARVLAPGHPEVSRRVRSALVRLGVTNSGKIEILFDEARSALPFRTYVLTNVAELDGKTIKTELVTTNLLKGWREYADLLLLAAVAQAGSAPAPARRDFHDALLMWDGEGFKDRATTHSGIYATYKLALYLIAANRLRITPPYRDEVVARLLGLQAPDGGWKTDYRDGKAVGLANVETTCLSLLALRTLRN